MMMKYRGNERWERSILAKNSSAACHAAERQCHKQVRRHTNLPTAVGDALGGGGTVIEETFGETHGRGGQEGNSQQSGESDEDRLHCECVGRELKDQLARGWLQ